MNPNEFKERIMMPPVPEPIPEPEPVEEPEHPTAPILENMMLNQDEKMSETNQLLEHILIKLDEEDDKTVEEHQLIKTDEVVSELKKLQEIIKEESEKTWDIKLTLV